MRNRSSDIGHHICFNERSIDMRQFVSFEVLPLASGDNCETFEAFLLFPFNSGSKKATGKQEANELKQSPTNGR